MKLALYKFELKAQDTYKKWKWLLQSPTIKNPLQPHKRFLTSLTVVCVCVCVFKQTSITITSLECGLCLQQKLIPGESEGLTKQAGVFEANWLSLEL